MTVELGDTILLNTGEQATVAHVFTHYKLAGDLIAEVEGERRLALAGEWKRTDPIRDYINEQIDQRQIEASIWQSLDRRRE